MFESLLHLVGLCPDRFAHFNLTHLALAAPALAVVAARARCWICRLRQWSTSRNG